MGAIRGTMNNAHFIFLFDLLSDSDGSALCEIVHTRSESEGRPERTFQLCCRYDERLQAHGALADAALKKS